jgi:hypothetical protein
MKLINHDQLLPLDRAHSAIGCFGRSATSVLEELDVIRRRYMMQWVPTTTPAQLVALEDQGAARKQGLKIRMWPPAARK